MYCLIDLEMQFVGNQPSENNFTRSSANTCFMVLKSLDYIILMSLTGQRHSDWPRQHVIMTGASLAVMDPMTEILCILLFYFSYSICKNKLSGQGTYLMLSLGLKLVSGAPVSLISASLGSLSSSQCCCDCHSDCPP